MIKQVTKSWPITSETPSRIFHGEEAAKEESRLSIAKPQRHRLPSRVMWTITLLTAAFVAVANWLIRIMGTELQTFKFKMMQRVMSTEEGFSFLGDLNGKYASAVMGALVLGGICAAYATVASGLVVFFAPQCAGSGLPEIKGYLNGNPTPSLFKGRCLPVIIFGIVFSTAAGFPIGREGPMVSIGGFIGFSIVRVLARRYTHHQVRVDDTDSHCLASFSDVERLGHAKRIGCTLGGAAGIATAFNSPIGGILYMFEEVTATSWSNECTLRAFICTVSGVLLSRGFLNLAGDDVHKLLIYEKSSYIWQTEGNDWTWGDLPLFVGLAAFVGLCSALFSRILLLVRDCRAARQQGPRRKLMECIFYAILCAVIMGLVPLIDGCEADDSSSREVANVAVAGRQLGSSAGFTYSRHVCEEGQHNEIATILLSNAEDAVKHLFSRSAGTFGIAHLCVALVTYAVLAMGMSGLSLPMGLFVPSMLIGALIGRCVGEAISILNIGGLSHPGIYALVGSASMLAGFTHMTIAIVVLLVEAVQDLSMVAPLMLGASVAYIVSTCINAHAYDEELVLRKGVPFLEGELPKDMDNASVTAGDICEMVPEQARLPEEASAQQVQLALGCRDVQGQMLVDFPVLDAQGNCVGLTNRTRLEAALKAHNQPVRISSSSLQMMRKLENTLWFSKSTSSDADTLECGGHPISVHRIMDPAPYLVLEEMPAPRYYPLFVKAGVTAACVVSRSGEFIGILSRVHLISAQKTATLHEAKSGTCGLGNRTPGPGLGSEAKRQTTRDAIVLGHEIDKCASNPSIATSSSPSVAKEASGLRGLPGISQSALTGAEAGVRSGRTLHFEDSVCAV